MAELSISETTTFRWSFEEDVAQYAAAGIPAIGVWRHKLSDCGQAKALDLLEPQRAEGLASVLGRRIHRQRRPQLPREHRRRRRGRANRRRVGLPHAGALQRSPGGPHLQPCPAAGASGAGRTGPAGRRVGRDAGLRADAPRLRRRVDVPHLARRYARSAGSGGQPAGQDGARHVPSRPAGRTWRAGSPRLCRRWRLSSLATPGGRPTASRTAAGWARASCRWPRSSPR